MEANQGSPKRFIFFYLMKDLPEVIGSVVIAHIEYWKQCTLNHYLGGPFADRSGGMITFACDEIKRAEEIIAGDPFVTSDLLAQQWIKEWNIPLILKQ